MCVSLLATVNMWRSEAILRYKTFPSTMWLPEAELSLPRLAASTNLYQLKCLGAPLCT